MFHKKACPWQKVTTGLLFLHLCDVKDDCEAHFMPVFPLVTTTEMWKACCMSNMCPRIYDRFNLFSGHAMNPAILEWGDLAAGRHAMLSAGAAHLHDKGLVNYLKILIWSIQESCIRLHGQSEPPDSIGLHYLWEPQKWDRVGGGCGTRGSKR